MTKTMQESVEDALRERISMLLDAIERARVILQPHTLAQYPVAAADSVLATAQSEATKPLPMLWRRTDPDLAARVKQLEADVRVLADAVGWCANCDEEKITQEVRNRIIELSHWCPLPHND